jgi:hypothetical protein
VNLRSPDPHAIVAEHFGFISRLSRRLGTGAAADGDCDGDVVLNAVPGLEELFASIVTASPTPRLVKHRSREEWNPLSQRMLLSDATPVPATALEADFSLVPSYAQTFVEWSHEAVHLLALESWFCGDRAIASAADFVAWYLAGEALAFWYADIVVTRAVRSTVPTADLVYSRNAVSNAGFHPEQAFRAVGLEDAVDILPLYIEGFLGRATPLGENAHPLCSAFAARLAEFYSGSRANLQALHDVLEGFDLFSGFQNRFCRVSRLPSLFEGQTRAALAGTRFAA